jgi:hypothetical protein
LKHLPPPHPPPMNCSCRGLSVPSVLTPCSSCCWWWCWKLSSSCWLAVRPRLRPSKSAVCAWFPKNRLLKLASGAARCWAWRNGDSAKEERPSPGCRKTHARAYQEWRCICSSFCLIPRSLAFPNDLMNWGKTRWPTIRALRSTCSSFCWKFNWRAEAFALEERPATECTPPKN